MGACCGVVPRGVWMMIHLHKYIFRVGLMTEKGLSNPTLLHSIVANGAFSYHNNCLCCHGYILSRVEMLLKTFIFSPL